MVWNWEISEWPNFKYDAEILKSYEAEFLHKSGIYLGTLKHLKKTDKKILEKKESGEVTKLMKEVYSNFARPLSHEYLWKIHTPFLDDPKDFSQIDTYRTSLKTRQIFSLTQGHRRLLFEAPPSSMLKNEMDTFIRWFNDTSVQGQKTLPTLTRAGIAHLYFVSVQPFGNANGKIARALVEKVISQHLGHLAPIALFKTINKQKKKYYDALGFSNREIEITIWLSYFARVILEALDYSQKSLELLVRKASLLEKWQGQINSRQEKALTYILDSGLEFCQEGIQVKNYRKLTQISRATANRDLQDLVHKKILSVRGKLKATKYYYSVNDILAI